MDELVLQAMAKWPNVPHCYGWLALDRRGDWYMRDAPTQALGAFVSAHPQAKGQVLRHVRLLEFIARNYARDADGAWYFQNGPQRVYVDLECTPWVWSIEPDFSLRTHTSVVQQANACFVDEAGWVYLDSAIGIGLVHSRDVHRVAEAVDSGRWSPQPIDATELPARCGFVRTPRPRVPAPIGAAAPTGA